MSDVMREFLRGHNIHEVECVIADMTGIARGKILPKDLFLGADHMRLPKSVLLNTVNGEQPNNTPCVGETDPDIACMPDPATIRVVPWARDGAAPRHLRDLPGQADGNRAGQCDARTWAWSRGWRLPSRRTFSRVISSWEREHLMLLV